MEALDRPLQQQAETLFLVPLRLLAAELGGTTHHLLRQEAVVLVAEGTRLAGLPDRGTLLPRHRAKEITALLVRAIMSPAAVVVEQVLRQRTQTAELVSLL